MKKIDVILHWHFDILWEIKMMFRAGVKLKQIDNLI